MISVMAHVSNQVTYHYVMLVGMLNEKFGLSPAVPQPLKVKVRCEWANQLVPDLNPLIGNFMGLSIGLASLLWVVVLIAFIFLAATKHSKTLAIVAIGILFGGLLLQSDFNPINSPCKGA